MKFKFAIAVLFFSTISLKGQKKLNWKELIIAPDLLINLPDSPQIYTDSAITIYEFKLNEVFLKVSSEKSPLNYRGRSIKEVNDEYFGSLTKRSLTSKQVLLKERDFKFENHNVRELIYLDSVDKKLATITLQILNVTGMDAVMYKFYLIDFKNRDAIPEKYYPFFKNWNLYNKLENEINDNSGNVDEILKEKGFSKKQKNQSNKVKISVVILIIGLILLILNNKSSR